MMAKSSILTFLALWFTFSVCLADEDRGVTTPELPSFPYPEEEESYGSQYILQFKKGPSGNTAKEDIFEALNEGRGNEEMPTFIMEIKSRNMYVINFPSEEVASSWNERMEDGLMYFEKGKKKQTFNIFDQADAALSIVYHLVKLQPIQTLPSTLIHFLRINELATSLKIHHTVSVMFKLRMSQIPTQVPAKYVSLTVGTIRPMRIFRKTLPLSLELHL